MRSLIISFLALFLLPNGLQAQKKVSNNVLVAENRLHLKVYALTDTNYCYETISYSGEFSSYGNLADSLLGRFFNYQSSKKKMVIIHNNNLIIIEYKKWEKDGNEKRDKNWRRIYKANVFLIKWMENSTPLTDSSPLSIDESIRINKKTGKINFEGYVPKKEQEE